MIVSVYEHHPEVVLWISAGADHVDREAVPASYDAHRATPLLVALHGATEQGNWMVNTWQQLAEDLGYVLLAPSSFGTVVGPRRGLRRQDTKEEQPIRDAITWVQQRYNVSAGQIGIDGFSDGASMSLYMGLTHGDIFCCLMANSAGGMGNNVGLPDKPAVFLTHGDADPVLPVRTRATSATPSRGWATTSPTSSFPASATCFRPSRRSPC